jgi:hypothetical protein
MALKGKLEIRHNGNIAEGFLPDILPNKLMLTGGSLKIPSGNTMVYYFI